MYIISGRDHRVVLLYIRVARSHDWGRIGARLVQMPDEVGTPFGEPCGVGLREFERARGGCGDQSKKSVLNFKKQCGTAMFREMF